MDISAARGALASFGRWLVSPSWVALSAAGCVVLAYFWVIGGPVDTIYSLQKDLSGGALYDADDLFLFNQIGRLKGLAGEATPLVAYIGGSTEREALLSESDLEEAIRAADGPPANVVELVASSQNMIDSWALTEVAACSGADLIVVGISPNRVGSIGSNHPMDSAGYYLGDEVADFVASGAYQPRFAGWADRVIAPMRAKTEALLAVIDSWLRHGPTVAEADRRHKGHHEYLGRKTSEEHARSVLGKVNDNIKARPVLDMTYVKRMKETAARCGAQFLVQATAINPMAFADDTYPELVAAHGLLRRLLPSIGLDKASILDMQDVELQPSDFYDWAHLMSVDAMGRTTHAIGGAIARLLGRSSDAP